jgi:very-short-patch-repair endonuclease
MRQMAPALQRVDIRLQRRYGGWQLLLQERIEQFAGGAWWILEGLALRVHGGNHRADVEVDQMTDKVIGMLGFDALGFQDIRGEVLEIECNDDIRPIADR